MTLIFQTFCTFAAMFVASAALAQPCSVTLKADGNTAAIQRAMEKPGKRAPVVCLRPGIYKGARLLATRDVVVKRVGKGKAVLDAGERGRVFTVLDKDISVTLQGITLTGGVAEEGGAIAVLRDAKVKLVDCWLTANRATRRGGGLHVGAGLLVAIRTRITRNDSPQAGAVFVAPGARAVLSHTVITENRNQGGRNAPVYLAPGAGAEILNSTIAYNHAHGVFVTPMVDGKRAMLRVASSVIMGGTHAIWVDRREAKAVEVESSVLHGQIGFIPLDLKCSRTLPKFSLRSNERYRPVAGSPAIDRGQCTGRFSKTDVSGRKRPRKCTAGAIESLPDDIKSTRVERAQRGKRKAKHKKADEAFNW